MSTKNEPTTQSKGQQLLLAAAEAAWVTEPDATDERNMELFSLAAAELLDSALRHIEQMSAHAAELGARVQELGQMARDVNSRRVLELEAQLEAIGAGGVSALMPESFRAQPTINGTLLTSAGGNSALLPPQCLHKITEPKVPLNPVAAMRVVLVADQSSPFIRGTSNWAAHIARAVEAAHGIKSLST